MPADCEFGYYHVYFKFQESMTPASFPTVLVMMTKFWNIIRGYWVNTLRHDKMVTNLLTFFITWTNDGPISRCMYASLDLDKLNFSISSSHIFTHKISPSESIWLCCLTYYIIVVFFRGGIWKLPCYLLPCWISNISSCTFLRLTSSIFSGTIASDQNQVSKTEIEKINTKTHDNTWHP